MSRLNTQPFLQPPLRYISRPDNLRLALTLVISLPKKRYFSKTVLKRFLPLSTDPAAIENSSLAVSYVQPLVLSKNPAHGVGEAPGSSLNLIKRRLSPLCMRPYCSVKGNRTLKTAIEGCSSRYKENKDCKILRDQSWIKICLWKMKGKYN